MILEITCGGCVSLMRPHHALSSHSLRLQQLEKESQISSSPDRLLVERWMALRKRLRGQKGFGGKEERFEILQCGTSVIMSLIAFALWWLFPLIKRQSEGLEGESAAIFASLRGPSLLTTAEGDLAFKSSAGCKQWLMDVLTQYTY